MSVATSDLLGGDGGAASSGGAATPRTAESPSPAGKPDSVLDMLNSPFRANAKWRLFAQHCLPYYVCKCADVNCLVCLPATP
ncbi:MAG: hypothetical protein GXP26_02980 [Planctomycetes bacterium]|nr:hypothetical protein [Planctomycetota bacterium]